VESVLRDFTPLCQQALELSRRQADALQDEDYDRLVRITDEKDATMQRCATYSDALRTAGISLAEPAKFAGSATERELLMECVSLLTRTLAVEKFNLRMALMQEQAATVRLGKIVSRRSVMKRYGGERIVQSSVNIQR
jgi:hypothetical protein